MNITTNSELEYFEFFIAIQSALLEKRYKLTPKEQKFLALCAEYHCKGGNLHDFEELATYLTKIGIVSTHQECSVYKNRLSIKKWIDTGRGRFRLPAALSKVTDYVLNIRCNRGSTGQSVDSVRTGDGPPGDVSTSRRRLLHELERVSPRKGSGNPELDHVQGDARTT